MYRVRRARVFLQSADNSNEEEEKEFEEEEGVKKEKMIPQVEGVSSAVAS